MIEPFEYHWVSSKYLHSIRNNSYSYYFFASGTVRYPSFNMPIQASPPYVLYQPIEGGNNELEALDCNLS